MTHASLFSGIGGFDYAAALLGWINIFDCEIDAFCRKVLEYHFPNSVHYGDIFNKQSFGCIRTTWQNFPTQSPICIGDDGISGRLDGITFSKWRQESVKAYGNAIVPQVAYEIFKAIELCR